MRQMMIHETHFGARLAKMMREGAKAAVLVRHAGIQARGIQNIQVSSGILSAQKTLQIRGKNAMWSGPTLANEVELVGTYLCKIETGTDGESRETSIMLDPADALLGHGKQQFAVTHDACGRIVHLRIVESKCDHAFDRITPAPRIKLRVSLKNEE